MIVGLETKCNSMSTEEVGLRDKERARLVEIEALREDLRRLELERQVWYQRYELDNQV